MYVPLSHRLPSKGINEYSRDIWPQGVSCGVRCSQNALPIQQCILLQWGNGAVCFFLFMEGWIPVRVKGADRHMFLCLCCSELSRHKLTLTQKLYGDMQDLCQQDLRLRLKTIYSICTGCGSLLYSSEWQLSLQ